MAKQLSAFILALFLIHSANAEEKFWDISSDTTQFHSLYFQDGLWRIDHFAQDDNGFLELLERQSFAKQESANQSFLKLKNAIPKQALRLAYTPNRPRLVKGFLWEATEKWNWEWEKKYSEWVRANVNKKFFADHNLPADCADAAYAFRWIFSRINKLPAANHLANGQWITHETYRKSWSRYPKHEDWQQDQRFLRALNDILDTTYTHSLMRDSYPVAINPESFREGIHHLHLSYSSGHTRIVNEVNANSSTKIPLKLIWATVPRDLANLTEGGFWDSHSPEKNVSGFLRILWPIRSGSRWVFEKKENIPHYSEEQYDENFKGEEPSFALALIKKIAPNFDPILIYENGKKLILDSIDQRIKIVEDGYAICSQQDCSEGTENYENWSTPSRDKRLLNNLKELETYLSSISQLTTEPMKLYQEALQSETISLLGQNYSLGLFRTIWLAKAFSFQPWDPIEERWPFEPTPFFSQLKKKLTERLAQRETQINNNPCLQSQCAAESENFKTWNTIDLDRQLRQLFLNATYFRKTSSPQNSQEFLQLLETETFNNESFLKALFRTHFYSSNPNAPLKERWGLNWSNSSFELHLDLIFHQENKKGYLAKEDSHGATLFKDGQALQTFAKQRHLVHLFSHGEVLLADENSQTYWLHDGSTPKDLQIPTDKGFHLFNSQTAILGQTMIRDEESGVQVYENINFEGLVNTNDEVATDTFWFFKNGTLQARHFSNGQITTVDLLQDSSPEASFSIEGIATNARYTLFRVVAHHNARQEHFRFNTTQKTFTKMSWSFEVTGAFNNSILMTFTPAKALYQLIQFDDSFQELDRLNLPGYASSNRLSTKNFLVSNEKTAHIYQHLQGLQFDVKKNLNRPNTGITYVTDRYYALYRGNEGPLSGDYELYDITTDTLQIKASWLNVEDRLGQDWFSIYEKDSEGMYHGHYIWKANGQWVRFFSNVFSTYPNNYTAMYPVDGELQYSAGGGVVITWGGSNIEFTSLSSNFFYLPGSVALELHK